MSSENIAHIAGALVSVAVARGTIVFCAALVVTVLSKGLRAEARHLLWTGVIASFALIPLAWAVLPSLPMDLGSRGPVADLGPFAAPALSRAEYALVIERTSVDATMTLRSPASPLGGWIPAALLATWCAGMLALAGRLVVGTMRLRGLASRGAADARLQSLGECIAKDLVVRRKFQVSLSNACRIPFTLGVFRPVIVLPEDAGGWQAARLLSVLTHEIAHVGRNDVLVHSSAYAVCVLFWFAPPVWLAYAALLREAEICCDQKVIDRGTRGTEYARDILELARSANGRMVLPCTSAALGRRGLLKDRILRVLSLRARRRPFDFHDTARVIAVCLCCLVPVLAVFGRAQSLALSKDDPLPGTWVNPKTDQSERFDAAKIIIQPDGHEFDYRHIAGKDPFSEAWNTVEKTWIDQAGWHQYEIRMIFWAYPGRGGKCEGFCRMRISPDGGTYEAVFAQYGYPEEITALGPGYSVAYRQK